jgi:very-short-patch-repair endonuclease
VGVTSRDRDRRIPIARRLRREATFQERLVWNGLRQLAFVNFHPRRQAPVGPYIVDFVCHRLKLIIEIDGDHHARGEQERRDRVRDADLAAHGYRVLRISNQHVAESFDGVMETVFRACVERGAVEAPTPNPSPPQAGGGEQSALRPPD